MSESGLMAFAFGLGGTTLVVGVEDDPDGSLRMYVGRRSKGIYAIVDDPAEQDRLRSAWGSGGHLLTAIPETLFQDDLPAAAIEAGESL
jgi:hypothetical protein